MIEPTALLANDVDPDATESLELVSVFGTTNGRAWIDLEGRVHVLADTPGDYTFNYVVADPQGATANGVVEVEASPAAQQQPPPSTTTTTPPQNDPPTTPPPTTTPPVNAPTTTAAPSGQLPSTGGGTTLWPWAATLGL